MAREGDARDAEPTNTEHEATQLDPSGVTLEGQGMGLWEHALATGDMVLDLDESQSGDQGGCERDGDYEDQKCPAEKKS